MLTQNNHPYKYNTSKKVLKKFLEDHCKRTQKQQEKDMCIYAKKPNNSFHLYKGICFFIEAIRTMFTTTFTTMPSF
jgi:hypothetical protein